MTYILITIILILFIYIIFDKITQKNKQKEELSRRKAEEQQALLMIMLLVGVEGLSRFIQYRKRKQKEEEVNKTIQAMKVEGKES